MVVGVACDVVLDRLEAEESCGCSGLKEDSSRTELTGHVRSEVFIFPYLGDVATKASTRTN